MSKTKTTIDPRTGKVFVSHGKDVSLTCGKCGHEVDLHPCRLTVLGMGVEEIRLLVKMREEGGLGGAVSELQAEVEALKEQLKHHTTVVAEDDPMGVCSECGHTHVLHHAGHGAGCRILGCECRGFLVKKDEETSNDE